MPAFDPTGHEAIHSLIEDFASIARHFHASENLEASLRRVTGTAETAIGGCEAASISLLTADGPVTHAATHRLAIEGDNIQYEENEGPCMDASMRAPWISTPDLGRDPRWPRSAARLSTELGVRSMFSSRLTLDAAPNQTLGGLNLYATVPEAFSTQDQMLAVLLTSLAAVVVDATRQQEQLRAAIESRQVIGEAIGILPAKLNLDSSEAFALLVKASQRTNVKLRDLARQIADGPSSPEPV
jgi:GAF domain-containing protein